MKKCSKNPVSKKYFLLSILFVSQLSSANCEIVKSENFDSNYLSKLVRVRRKAESLSLSSSSSSSSSSSPPTLSTEFLKQSQRNVWKPLLELSPKQFDHLFLPGNVNITTQLLNNSLLSAKCRTALKWTIVKFNGREASSVTMFNSWGHFPPTGLRSGTMTDLGDYDQCLSLPDVQYCLLEAPIPMPERSNWTNLYDQADLISPDVVKPFTGSAKTIGLPVDETFYMNSFYVELANISSFFHHMSIQTGICLPAECTEEDSIHIGNALSSNFNIKTKKSHCEQPTSWQLNRIQILALLVSCSIIILNILAYIIHRLESGGNVSQNAGRKSTLQWFNPKLNLQKILCSQPRNDDLSSLHGIRALTMLWIVAGHALDWNALNMFHATFRIRDHFGHPLAQPFFKAYYAVDTFFLLSGLLTAFVTMKYTNGSIKNFSSFGYILIRYLRLTPQLGLYLLFSTLLPLLASGPVWFRNMHFMLERCYTTWWRNMLYIQNTYDMANMCALHSWYLAADMQLHWLSVIPITIILWNSKLGRRVTHLILGISILLLGIVVFVGKLPPGILITARYNLLDDLGGPASYLQFFYKPWSHAPAFLIGLLFGHWIWQKSAHTKINREKNFKQHSVESNDNVKRHNTSRQQYSHSQQQKLQSNSNDNAIFNSKEQFHSLTQKCKNNFNEKLFSIAKTNFTFQLNQWQKCLVWSLCTVLYIVCLYDTWPWHYGETPSQLTSALLYPLNNVCWSIMLITIMWMCITDNGGYVNTILSSKIWRPLSRVTYSVYLTHPWVIAVMIGSRRQPFVQDFSTVFSHILTVYLLSFIVGLLFSILFEAPFCIAMEHLRPFILPKQTPTNSDAGTNFLEMKQTTNVGFNDSDAVTTLLDVDKDQHSKMPS